MMRSNESESRPLRLFSRPLAVPLVFFIIGISITGNIQKLPAKYIFAIGFFLFLLIIFSVLMLKKDKIFYLIICLFFFLFGIFVNLRSIPAVNDIGKFIGEIPEEVLVFGSVADTAEERNISYGKYLVFPFKVEKLLLEGKEISAGGKIYIKLFNSARKIHIGEKLIISGRISKPPYRKNYGSFNYRRYLNHKGIRAVMLSAKNDIYLKAGVQKNPLFLFKQYLAGIRSAASGIFEKYLLKDAKAIAKSVVLGIRRDITKDVSDIFIKTGTMHILAVSGLHMGITAALIIGVLRIIRCPRSLIYFLTIMVLFAFMMFTGARPSSIRACLMAVFVLLSLLIKREPDIINALIFSVFVIIFFKPEQFHNLGFILSYLSILAVIYITPLFYDFFSLVQYPADKNNINIFREYLIKSLSVSFAVWVGILPVIALNFQIITPAVIISNIFAIPVLFITIILGFSLILMGMVKIFIPLAIFTAHILNNIIPFSMKIMQMILRIPFAFIKISSPQIILIILFYTGLFFTLIFYYQRKYKTLIIIFLLFAMNLFIWQEVFHHPPVLFNCTFFDTGKADSTLLEFSDSSIILIDGASGGEKTGKDDGRNVVAAYLRQKSVRKIDCIFVTHIHEDHIGGLIHILKNFKIGTIVMNSLPKENDISRRYYADFLEIIKEKKIRCLTVEKGDIIKGFSNVDLAVLSPEGKNHYKNENDRSLVVKLYTRKGNSILFCGDISAEVMKDILCFGSFLKSDIIKIPHHGSGLGDISVVEEFLDTVNCTAAVINNRIGGVDKNLLQILKAKNLQVYITAETGSVTAKEGENGFEIQSFCGYHNNY